MQAPVKQKYILKATQVPEMNRCSQLLCPDTHRVVEVGDGARHFQGAVPGTCRQVRFFQRRLQQAAGSTVRFAAALPCQPACQVLIGSIVV
jgi:hypothetical protein